MNAPKIIVLAIALLVGSGLYAQSGFDGNDLVAYLNKEAASSELKELKTHYNCEMANEARYLSKAGIELLLKDGVLNEIHLFRKSAVYGSFTGKLPHNLRFGMSSGDLKALLGKPVVSYNSGYCEFGFSSYIISCWFEEGGLSQVGISVK